MGVLFYADDITLIAPSIDELRTQNSDGLSEMLNLLNSYRIKFVNEVIRNKSPF